MPIKVQCACGKAFAAKDELAGKTVKCPNCQQPLKIPGGPAASAKAATKPAAAPAAKPAAAKPAPKPASATAPRPAPANPAVSSGDSLFDEIGLKKAAAGTRPCPGCMEPMPADAVICIKCGYNAKIGRRMETVKVGMDTGAGGHGAVAEDLLHRAAQTMDEDAAEEKKKTGEGAPWWVWLVGLCLLLGFGAMMLLLPLGTALRFGGFGIIAVVWFVVLYAWINILMVAFREGPLHGIGCLLCGLYVLIYSIMRWDQCGTYLLTMIGAQLVGGGVQYAILQFPPEKPGQPRTDLGHHSILLADSDYNPASVKLLKDA